MKFTLTINQKEIIEAGITGVDAIDMLVFDVAMNAIRFGDLDEPEVIDGKTFQWVSYNLLIQELPLLKMSKATIKRRVANLVAAGLLEKSSANEDQRKLFMALTPLAKKLFTDAPSRFKNELGGGVKNEQGVGSDLNPNKNTNNNSTINHISPTPLNGVPSETPPKPKREPTVKKKLTRKEATDFYENEFRVALETPLPPDVLAAAAARGIPQERIAARYRELVDYMMKPSEAWPNGMWGCVLTKPNQLSFEQFARLVFIKGMSSDGINDYLNQWENKSYDNNNIYATFCGWWAKEKAKPANGHSNEPPKRGLSIPKTVTQ